MICITDLFFFEEYPTKVARRLAIDKAIDFMPETATSFFDRLPEIMDAPPNVLIVGGLVKDLNLKVPAGGTHVSVAGGDSVVFQSGSRKASFSLGSKVPVNGNPDAAA